MNVSVKREAGRVVAEPGLHLHDIPALDEQSGGDGLAERMEARPLDTGGPARRREHMRGDVVWIEHRAGGRPNTNSSGAAPTAIARSRHAYLHFCGLQA